MKSQELVDVEDLVLQMIYFVHTNPDSRYVGILNKNLIRRLMEYLQIDHEDMQDLLSHEQEHHHAKPHTSKNKSKIIHSDVDKEKIKKNCKRILQLIQKHLDKKIGRKEQIAGIEKNTSSILKILKSEHHELEMVKTLVKHQKRVERKHRASQNN